MEIDVGDIVGFTFKDGRAKVIRYYSAFRIGENSAYFKNKGHVVNYFRKKHHITPGPFKRMIVVEYSDNPGEYRDYPESVLRLLVQSPRVISAPVPPPKIDHSRSIKNPQKISTISSEQSPSFQPVPLNVPSRSSNNPESEKIIKHLTPEFTRKVEIWKRNLLDLSRRNRQLYFLPNAKTSIEILTSDTQSFFKSFIMDEKIYTFINVYDPQEFSGSEENIGEEKESGENEEILSSTTIEDSTTTIEQMLDNLLKSNITAKANAKQEGRAVSEIGKVEVFNGQEIQNEEEVSIGRNVEDHKVALQKAMNKAKPTDLITKLDDKKLQQLLKRTRQRGRLAFEEQGINTLFVTFGILKWYEPNESKPVYTPLLFVPASLTQEGMLNPFKLEMEDDEVVSNLALEEKFQYLFKMKMPKLEEEIGENSLQKFIDDLNSLIPPDSDWEVQSRVFVGNFSFAKLTLFSDITQHPELLAQHPILNALAGGGGYVESQDHIPVDEELGDNIDPINSYSILDSDSSQERAIQFAKKGASLVIHGPPGTGKSQCISNIIAECLAMGNKVLFVAEKMAALEVVKKRLDEHHVGEFCLEIHSYKANKAEVLRQIEHSIGTTIAHKEIDKGYYENLKILRKKLNGYITDLYMPIGSTQQSIYQKMAEFSKYRNIPNIEGIFTDPLSLSQEDVFQIRDMLATLATYRNILEKYNVNPWLKCKLKDYRGNIRDELIEKLQLLVDAVTKFEEIIKSFEDTYNLVPVTSITALEAYKKFFISYNFLALQLDTTDLIRQFGCEFSSFARYFKPAYFRARKLVQNCIKLSTKKPITSHLSEIREFKDCYLQQPFKSSYETIEKEFSQIWSSWNQIVGSEKSLKNILIRNTTNDSKDFKIEGPDWLEPMEFGKYWLHQMSLFDDWCSIQTVRQKLKSYNIPDFFEQIINHPFPENPLDDIFFKKYVEQWLMQANRKFPLTINNFNEEYHLRSISTFKELDKNCIKENEYRLCDRVFQSRPNRATYLATARSSEENVLQKELHKKCNIMPLRKLFQKTMKFVTTIKPCFLMSPLSVANYLPIEDFAQFFDLVVFDEASQICPEDAVGAIARGKQLIVVGDEHQLPPTRFFSANLADGTTEDGEQTEVFDSILDQCCTIGMPESLLNWHYRSKKEGLIAFSNRYFYDNRLTTFPDLLKASTNNSENVNLLPAIEFHHIKNGIYDKGKSRKNQVEARVVAKAIIKHYQKNRENGTRYSLGVVTFSQAQQEAVEDALDENFEQDPNLETLINSGSDEPYFIKNLENVQGDERDYIFFSVGYGKDASGNLLLNFGPLNKTGGERRLNVAISRARYHVKIFCSFIPSEVDLTRISNLGPAYLLRYLEFAQSNKLQDPTKTISTTQKNFDSDFEEEVYSTLEQLGYSIDTQIGCSGYHIDLAIVNPNDPSHYLLGIECDGASYHSSQTARDRDRLRHEVLEGLGWHIYHIWSSHWFSNKRETIAKIQDTITQLLTVGPAKNENCNKVTGVIKSPVPIVEFIEKSKEETNVKTVDKSNPQIRKKLFDEFQWLQPYQKYKGVQKYSPQLFTSRSNMLQNVALEIIQKEGPIHRDILIRRLLDTFNIPRKTPSINQFLNSLLDPQYIFFYPPKWDVNIVRISVNTSDEPRKFTQISDIEITSCMSHLLKQIYHLERKDLYLEVVRIFGFGNVQKGYYVQLDAALQNLINKNIAIIHGEEVKIIE